MRLLLCFIFLSLLFSCAKKTYAEKHLLPDGIQSITEEIYTIEKNQKILIQKKSFILTNNGGIKTSKTWNSLDNLIQEREKRTWFIKETNFNTEPYYCKTRWKPKSRERISCYIQKRDKKNESIYHYNKNGSIHKIVDNFTSFYTQTYYYSNNNLSKIVTIDKNGKLIDEVQISCEAKDEKGVCLRQLRISSKTTNTIEIHLTPIYR